MSGGMNEKQLYQTTVTEPNYATRYLPNEILFNNDCWLPCSAHMNESAVIANEGNSAKFECIPILQAVQCEHTTTRLECTMCTLGKNGNIDVAGIAGKYHTFHSHTPTHPHTARWRKRHSQTKIDNDFCDLLFDAISISGDLLHLFPSAANTVASYNVCGLENARFRQSENENFGCHSRKFNRFRG